jgi:3-oxoacyl-[acyl-carrier-protein] synthase-3
MTPKRPARPVGIRGLGAYLPVRRLENAELQQLGCPVTPEWILEKTGILARHVAADDEAMSDLAIPAIRNALEVAEVAVRQLDGLVVAGDFHDYGGVRLTSGVVADALGLHGRTCIDLRVGCPGSIFALHEGAALVGSGLAECLVVVAAEVSTRGADWTSRTAVWFGDGAAAAVLAPCRPGTGILWTVVAGDGHGAEILQVPAGGSREPTSPATVAQGRHVLHMDARAVFPWAVERFVETVGELTRGVGVPLDSVAAIVPHQANLRIIHAAMLDLGLPMDMAVVNVDHVGNTGSPATLLALHDGLASGRLHAGDLVVLVGFGGGLAWGGQLLRLNSPCDFPSAEAGRD